MKSTFFSSPIMSYTTNISRGEELILQKLREETQKLPEAIMMITPLQGRVLEFLVRWGRVLEFLVRWGRVKYILEVGTFTGYSALAMALALPDEGKLVTLDKHVGWTQIAQQYWRMAGVASKVELRLGLAHETLLMLGGPFDMIFIDADKQRYGVYYDFALKLLRPGGLMVFDNTLWKGAVADLANAEETPQSLRAFNTRLREDNRVYPILLPLADGMTLAIKR